MTSTQPLSRRVLDMEESATIRMSQLARDLTSQGHDVINLSLGEPDFDTPDHIKAAAKEALDMGYTKYTPVPGLVEFREAISKKFLRDNDLHYALDQIVVSNGAKQSVNNLFMALCDPGDEVVVLAPYWVSYSAIIELSGGVPVVLRTTIDDDFKVSADRIDAAITSRTKAVIFSSPCNPSGSVYTAQELSDIADVIGKHKQITIISDEIYEHINFLDRHTSIGSMEAVQDQTVTINGMSKGFAMTGWRLGYIGAPKWLAAACSKLQSQSTSGASSFGQKAAAIALNSDLQSTRDMKAAFMNRKKLIQKGLEAIPGMKVNDPKGAFYIFPDISSFYGKSSDGFVVRDSNTFSEYLLQRAHVATVGGSSFGADECFRLSYAASEEDILNAVKRIADAVNKLS